ncbi:hypothetical protein [Rhizobium etli]|uniref:Uncharacterized protein n=1 Tax=Rhizobium etli TaxID=29449 RepID=A0A7W6V6K1_RHIET|nr:hypothetical protein [Rhizobium etli]MBB4477694.1 hypothetical protein [Rhizobium etli]MBB4533526.1 hypothetical protein [Rhizobium etli]
MVFKPQRWMTRDFIFTAPPAFPDVTALQPERFHFRPHPRNLELPALVVAAFDGSQPWDLDAGFAAIAADLIGSEDQTEWSLAQFRCLDMKDDMERQACPLQSRMGKLRA